MNVTDFINTYNLGSFIINAHGGLTGGQFEVEKNFYFITVAPLGEATPEQMGERIQKTFMENPNVILNPLNHDHEIDSTLQIRHHPAGSMMNDISLEFRAELMEQRIPIGIRQFPWPQELIDRPSMSIENPYQQAIFLNPSDYQHLNGRSIPLSELIKLIKKNCIGGVFVLWTCRSCIRPLDERDDEEITVSRVARQASNDTDNLMRPLIAELVRAQDEQGLNIEMVLNNAKLNGSFFTKMPLPNPIYRITQQKKPKTKTLETRSATQEIKKEEPKVVKKIQCRQKELAEQILSSKVGQDKFQTSIIKEENLSLLIHNTYQLIEKDYSKYDIEALQIYCLYLTLIQLKIKKLSQAEGKEWDDLTITVQEVIDETIEKLNKLMQKKTKEFKRKYTIKY